MPDESKNSCPIPDDGRSKLKEHPNRLRLVIQLGFVVFSVFLCLQFRSFVLCLSGPTNEPVNSRPPAVEAYLPISSLMSLTYLVKTGVTNRIHPAGLVIFYFDTNISSSGSAGLLQLSVPNRYSSRIYTK